MTDTTDIKVLRIEAENIISKLELSGLQSAAHGALAAFFDSVFGKLEAERQRADAAHKYGSERDAENESLMLTVGRLRVEIEALKGEQVPVALTVWYGSMPETNGKENWTAIIHRKGACISEGITIDRSEYPDRVRYEADRMRCLIGEIQDEPDILAYDADKRSDYVYPVTAPKNPVVLQPSPWRNSYASVALRTRDEEWCAAIEAAGCAVSDK
jgi:hypothetical protein